MGRIVTIEKEQPPTHSFEPLIDSIGAAELLRIHRKTVERMALRGEIPGHKIGRFWRFRPSELDEWLRSKFADAGLFILRSTSMEDRGHREHNGRRTGRFSPECAAK